MNTTKKTQPVLQTTLRALVLHALALMACEHDEHHDVCTIEYSTDASIDLPEPIISVGADVVDADCFGDACSFACDHIAVATLQWPGVLCETSSIAVQPQTIVQVIASCEEPTWMPACDDDGELYRCDGEDYCIPFDYFCDAFQDCPMGEDESGCADADGGKEGA